jgi:hypothetical protein
MPNVRTPRQPPGDGLVPLTVQVTPFLRTLLNGRAEQEGRSISYVARDALQRHLAPEPPVCEGVWCPTCGAGPRDADHCARCPLSASPTP